MRRRGARRALGSDLLERRQVRLLVGSKVTASSSPRGAGCAGTDCNGTWLTFEGQINVRHLLRTYKKGELQTMSLRNQDARMMQASMLRRCVAALAANAAAAARLRAAWARALRPRAAALRAWGLAAFRHAAAQAAAGRRVLQALLPAWRTAAARLVAERALAAALAAVAAKHAMRSCLRRWRRWVAESRLLAGAQARPLQKDAQVSRPRTCQTSILTVI